MSDSVKVAVRIRPLIQRERDAEILWTNTERSIQQQKATGKAAVPYQFDRVFGISETTADVYREIAVPIISSAMLGFNGTIFAYGQTSSGKTFTMMGNEQYPGIIPGVVNEIFDSIENNPEREYLIRVSYLEIYNENITDLLAREKKPLDVREDTEGKVFVPNLTEELVNTKAQIFKLMSAGDLTRHVGATNMNESSSRSHAIFRIIIESRVRDQEGAVMVSQLNLVDLAGSEKAKATGATGVRLTEGGFINKSLFILGNVISQLSDNNAFISYRDSRLTRILQNSLGGNSKTAIICNISPAALEETHSSLRFATNAKRIKNKPVQNEVVSDEAMMQRYKKEIDVLKKELQQTRNLKAGGLLEVNEQLQQQLAAKEQVQAAQEERINRLTALICVSSQIRPTTPGPLTLAAKRKRRETWCPGKAGKAQNKPTKSLSAFNEALERENDLFSPAAPKVGKIVGFELSDSSPEAPPDLKVDVSRFSNEDLEFMETGCQTEEVETETPLQQVDSDVLAAKEEQIQELTREVENLTKIIDDNLQEVGETETKLSHEMYSVKERLHEVEQLNSALQEKLATSEEQGTLLEEQLNTLKAEKAKPAVRTSSFGGLELVQQQLEKLRSQLEEKDIVLQEKEREVSQLKREYDESVFLTEETLDEVRNITTEKDKMRDERDALQIKLEELHIQIEKREDEFKETEEFLQLERGLQDDSIMYKQYGEELVTELQKKVSVLEKTSRDSQAVLVDLNKKLATSNTELQDLQLKLTTAETELKQLTNEKADFEMYQDLEREKHKRRETELTAQLEEAYREAAELRSAAGPSVVGQSLGTSIMGQSLDMSLQAALACHMGAGGGGNLEASMAAADTLEVEQLNAQIADLQEQLSRLASEIGEVRAERESAVATLETMKEEMATVSDDRASLQEEKGMLEENLKKLQEEKLALEDEHKNEAEQANKSEGEEHHRLEAEKLSLETDKQDLKKERETLTEEKSCLEQEKLTFDEEKQAFHEKLTAAEEEKSAIEQENAVLVEEKEALAQEKTVVEEDKVKIQEERVVVEELKDTLETEKTAIDSEKDQLKSLKEELEEDRLAFEEEKIMEKEMKECIMEEEMKRLEKKKEELDEERRLLQKKIEEFEAAEQVKSGETEKSDESENDSLAAEKELIVKEKASIEEQQKSLEEMLTCLEEERIAFDADKKELDDKKVQHTILEEERNMLQLEKRAMDEHIAALEEEIKSLKEERDAQQEESASSDHVEEYKEKIAALEREIEDSKKVFEEEREQLQNEHSTSEEERKTLEKELEDLKKTYEEEKGQLQEGSLVSDEEKEALRKELDDLIRAYEEEKAQLQKESELSVEEKDALVKELDHLKKTYEEEKEQLQKESELSAEEKDTLVKELDHLKKTYEENEQLQRESQIIDEEKEALLKELEELKRASADEKEMFEKENGIFEQEKQLLEEENKTLEEERKSLEVESHKNAEECEALKDKLNVLEEESKDLLAQLQQSQDVVTQLREELSQLQSELSKMKEGLPDEEIERREAALSELRREFEAQRKEDKEQSEKELQEQILAIRTEAMAKLEEAKTMLPAADLDETGMMNAEVQLEMANVQLANLTAQRKQREEELVEKRMTILKLEKTIKTLEEEKEEDLETIQTLNEEMENLKKGTQAIVIDVKEERDAAWNTIKEMQEEVDRLTKREEELEQQAELHTEEVEQLNECVNEQHIELDKEHKKISTLEDQVSDLKTSLATLSKEREDDIERLNTELDLKQETLTSLEDQLATSKAETTSQQETSSTEEVAKLKAEVEEYKELWTSAIKERDSERNLMDAADDELEQKTKELEAFKKVTQKNEVEAQRKIAELQEQLSTVQTKMAATSGSASPQEVAKLQAQVEEYKELWTSAIKERDSERDLMDAADDELEQKTKELEAFKKVTQKNEVEAQRKIAELQEQLSTVKAGTTSHQNAAMSGTASSQEMAKLKAEVEEYKGLWTHAINERDSERKLMDEADEELEQKTKELEAFKKVTQKNELESQRKIAQLKEQLSSGGTATTSSQEVAKLKAEVEEYKELWTSAIKERDSERDLMDAADDELEQKTKELEAFKKVTQKNELEAQRKIAQLKNQLAAVNPGAAADETQETSDLKTKLARTEIQERRLKQKNVQLVEEIQSYKERLTTLGSTIRRLQNQNSETSFMPNQRSGRSLPASNAPAPVAATAEPVGIVGSVKVLALESDNARLQRELNKAAKQLEEQRKALELYKRRQEHTDERPLKSLPNGASPAKPPTAESKTKGAISATGKSTSRTAVSKAGAPRRATAEEDPYAASLDVSTLAGVKLEDDAYVALLGRPDTLIRDLYEPLFREEQAEREKAASKEEEVQPCAQQ